MKKLFIFTLIVSVMTLGGLWSGKKFCTMMSMPAGGRSGQALYSEMGLDASQTKSVGKLEVSFRKEADALCMRICQERVKLLEQIKNNRMSQEAIYKRVEEIGGLQISLEKKVIAHIFEVNKGLTASQSKAYLERIYQQQCQIISQSGYGDRFDKSKGNQ